MILVANNVAGIVTLMSNAEFDLIDLVCVKLEIYCLIYATRFD